MNKNLKFSIENYVETGLTQQQAQENLTRFGLNQVQGKKPPSDFYFLIKQFQNPLVLVLVIAILITVIMKDFSDAFVIALAVLVNTTLGFIQERKAFKSLESLKKVVNHTALVIRNANRIETDITSIVPGDIILVFEGDKIPADGLVIENNDLLVEEAILTGESIPVEKSTFQLLTNSDSVFELLSKITNQIPNIRHEYKAFMGTAVTSGSGKILITNTGMNTQIGGIAQNIGEYQETHTPLEKKLDSLAKFITIGVVLLSIAIFLTGIATNRDPLEMFTTAVAIAVAAIPEGLVIGLTAILAIGMRRILKRKGLVRTLVAAETLGSVTVVCIDKTGTLTEGKMRVSEVKTDDKILLYKASTFANDRKDPIEIARWKWAQTFAYENQSILPEELVTKYKRTAGIPFSVERRFLAVQIEKEIFLSGAPEEMLERSTASPASKKEYLEKINEWAHQGKRLIGYGYIKSETKSYASELFKKLKDNSNEINLTWLGVMAFDDPVRPNLQQVIKKTKEAGIDIKVITGDYSSTAISVLKQIGIEVNNSQLMEGSEVESLSITELQARLHDVILFARTKPSHKLKIVQALSNNSEIVGMMGDGVNDAPALAIADIGIVVENASEIAKESSELILLDSNMNTIIAAIEEGRSMFDNLRKVILYLLSDSFAELIIVLVSILTGFPLAISAVQILWINLIDDGFPNLALTVDPKSSDLLKRKPLPRATNLINSEMLALIFIISLTTAVGCLYAFHLFLPNGIVEARTVVFAILSLDSLLYVFSCRSLEKNIWESNPFANTYLLYAVGFGLILTIASIYLSQLQKLLDTTALSFNDWIVVGLISIVVMVIIETFKWVWNHLRK